METSPHKLYKDYEQKSNQRIMNSVQSLEIGNLAKFSSVYNDFAIIRTEHH